MNKSLKRLSFLLLIQITTQTVFSSTETLLLYSPLEEASNLQEFRVAIGKTVKQTLNTVFKKNPLLKQRLNTLLEQEKTGGQWLPKIKIKPLAQPSWTPHITHLFLSNVPTSKRSCINKTILATLNAYKDALKTKFDIKIPNTVELKRLGEFIVLTLRPKDDIPKTWEFFSHELDAKVKTACAVDTKHFENYQKPGQAWIPHVSLLKITPHLKTKPTLSEYKEKITELLQEKDDTKKALTITQHIEGCIATIDRTKFNPTFATLTLDTLILARGNEPLTKFTFNKSNDTWIMKIVEKPDAIGVLIEDLEMLRKALAKLAAILITKII